jgi:glycosyltransferase involved in cell wall biosynthesis
MLDERLKLPHLNLRGKPSSPIEPWRLFLAMRNLPAGAALFTPGYNSPLLVTRPFVFTIHDLNHLDRPENSSFLKRFYYQLIMRRAARQAFRVLTVSEFSRRRLIEWANLDPAMVINVGNGVEPRFNTDVVPFEPGHPYLLCVGNRKPHKNEARVLEAFARAKIDPAIRLLFTGEATPELAEISSGLAVDPRVSFLGRVAEEKMPTIYRGARALLFPSLYEGFGLPVIEAMACGTPVLTSNTTAMPEVAADAALLVDPLAVEQIARGIEQLCGNETLRVELHRKGLLQAARFSWEDVAAKVRKVLDELQASQGKS